MEGEGKKARYENIKGKKMERKEENKFKDGKREKEEEMMDNIEG